MDRLPRRSRRRSRYRWGGLTGNQWELVLGLLAVGAIGVAQALSRGG